jgi:DNA-directed RNA polymerase subunit RPC12/RpoP
MENSKVACNDPTRIGCADPKVVKENHTETSMWYTCIECGKPIDSAVVDYLARRGRVTIQNERKFIQK